jgi:hypothetical protein
VSVDRSRAASRRTPCAWHWRDHAANARVVDAVSILGQSNGAASDMGARPLGSARHLRAGGLVVDPVGRDMSTLGRCGQSLGVLREAR